MRAIRLVIEAKVQGNIATHNYGLGRPYAQVSPHEAKDLQRGRRCGPQVSRPRSLEAQREREAAKAKWKKEKKAPEVAAGAVDRDARR